MDGAGYTILPYAVVCEEVQGGLLSAARIVEPDLVRPLGFAIRPNGALSVVTNKLAGLVQLELGELLAKGNWMGHEVAKNAGTNTLKSPPITAYAAEAV